jgi:hypothetical protein
MEIVCEEGLRVKQFVNFEFCECYGFGGEVLTLWFVVLAVSCNFISKEL